MDSVTPPIIRLENISKFFGRVQANREVTLEIRPGRVKALLGENGAGKSTLMSILSGRIQPDTGRVILDGMETRIHSTHAAHEAGIGMVYQHFTLVEAMTVAENIVLGQSVGFWLSRRGIERHVTRLAEEYGMAIDPRARVSELSMGERQRVEILKLLQRESRVLIFDEPTTVLTPMETEQLFRSFRRMTGRRKAIVFITHKLDEVMAVADEIAILRKGSVVAEMDVREIDSKADLARRMVGREVLLQVHREPVEKRRIVLRIEGLAAPGLAGVHLQLRQGEILGVVGVAGNGQKPLVETVCGMKRPESGSVRILGQDWDAFHRNPAQDGTMIHIPEDRRGLAACLDMNLIDNFLLTTRRRFSRGPWLLRQAAREKTVQLMGELDVQPPDPLTTARSLSGGNLQKLVLAREFSRRPRLIVAEQPTQGLYINATEEIWKVLLNARKEAGVLLVTGDLNEALTLSDRIAVMFGGRITDTFDVGDADQVERIGLLMAGVVQES